MEPYLELERRWAEFNDLDPAGMVCCASGTAALHLALESLQLPAGSEVIQPDFSMVAVPRATVMAGLEPVFVDCDERLLIDLDLATVAVLTNRQDCKVVVFVHIYGRRLRMDSPLLEAVDGQKFYLVEDLAEAHGVKPHAYADAACYSFYQNKLVAGAEGGAVWFAHKPYAELARQLRSLGFTDKHDFNHIPRGWNHRLSNAHARLILNSLEMYEGNLALRRQIEGWCDAACPDEWKMPPRDVPWVYDLRIPGLTKEAQDQIVAELRAQGIPARHFFQPMHCQEEFKDCRRVGGEAAEKVGREGLYLSLQPGLLTEEKAEQTFARLRQTCPAALPQSF